MRDNTSYRASIPEATDAQSAPRRRHSQSLASGGRRAVACGHFEVAELSWDAGLARPPGGWRHSSGLQQRIRETQFSPGSAHPVASRPSGCRPLRRPEAPPTGACAPRGFQRLARHSHANAGTPQTTLRHGEIPSRNLDGDGFMQELSLQKQRRVGAGLDCLPQSPENPSRIPMFPQCWGYAKTHDVVTVHHTPAPLRADAARPEMAQTPEGARHHPNDAHRDAMAGSSRCSIRARRDATRRQRRRRPQRSPASSRASLLKTTQHATTTAPDRNQMKSRCMRWDNTEKP